MDFLKGFLESAQLLQNDYIDFLYKFRKFDNYTESLLLDNQLFFSSPQNFNDPLDCKTEIRYDLGSFHSIYEKHLEFLNITKPFLSNANKKVEAKVMAKNIVKNQNNKELRQKLKNQIFNSIDTSIGICSFSGNNNNILLWSHYADSHKGFCVKINYKALQKELEKLFRRLKIVSYLIKRVNYNDEYEELNPYTMNDVLLQIKLFITKMKDWEYEDEYRILIPEFVNSKINFNDDVIESIYVGAKISSENLKKIIGFMKMKPKKKPVFKTIIDHRSLNFKSFDY